MPKPVGFPSRKPDQSLKHRLEVATAMAEEALVEAHVAEAARFVRLFEGALPLEDALERYMTEMEFAGSLASAVRNKALVAVGDGPRERGPAVTPPASRPSARATSAGTGQAAPPAGVESTRPSGRDLSRSGPADTRRTGSGDGDDEDRIWSKLRPDRVVRGVIERQRRHEELDGWIALAIARAEEAVIGTHVENAIAFAALLEKEQPLARAVQEYISEIGLSGGRAQAVNQRAMARLASVHLPDVRRGR